VNQQNWDPGGDLYLFDGCQSWNGVINLEEKQLVCFLMQRSQESYRQFLTQELYHSSPIKYQANVGFPSRMSGCDSGTILLASSMHLYGILLVSSPSAGSNSHQECGSFRDVGPVILKLHFYNLVIEDP
jgi:hypothetical protein